MSRVRIPIAGLMAAVMIVAVDAAIVRSMILANSYVPTSPTTTMGLVVFAMGVLPMASLLIFVALIRLPKLARVEADATSFVGFEVVGWATVFLFVVASAVSPPAVANYVNTVAWPIGRVLAPMVVRSPEWLITAVEFVLIVAIFFLPELAIAMLGGWLARRAGFTVRIGRTRRSEAPAIVEEAEDGSARALHPLARV